MNLQRLLIGRMENRVLVGTTMFLATMVLVGWVAINEPGRMEAFGEQHLARSIEHGAELYVHNCAECHGANGLGTGRAPALNNPQLFGVNFFADIDTAVADLRAVQTDITALQTTLAGDTSGMTSTEIADVEARLQAYVEQYGDDPLAAVETQIAEQQTQRSARVAQMQQAVDRGYDPETGSRLDMLGWGGTLHSFVQTTLIAGRPVSTSYWPEPMPAWSQRAGGPLRDDQIENLTSYIMNWGDNRDWTLEDLLAVSQFAKIPQEAGGLTTEAVAPELVSIEAGEVAEMQAAIDENISRVLAELEEVSGDPNNGLTLYTGSLACSACHANAAIAPPTEGTFTRAEETRIQDPLLTDHSARQYLVESILVPNAYIAPGYPPNAMPQDFGQRLDIQMLADLIAYVESQDGADPLAN